VVRTARDRATPLGLLLHAGGLPSGSRQLVAAFVTGQVSALDATQPVVGTIAAVEQDDLRATVDACRSLIRDRFPDDDHHGAAAMLLDDGTIITGTVPEAIKPLSPGLS
jgi:hypothetical protein